MEKALNSTVLVGILVALVILIAQNAGLMFQRETKAIEVNGSVAVTKMPVVDIQSAYGPLEVEIESFGKKLQHIDVNLEAINGHSLFGDRLPVDLQAIGSQDVGITASRRFGVISNGILSGSPIEWGSVSIVR